MIKLCIIEVKGKEREDSPQNRNQKQAVNSSQLTEMNNELTAPRTKGAEDKEPQRAQRN